MIIAAVLNKSDEIVPIVEGVTLRLYDTEKKSFEDYENPAIHLKEGRRGAALRFAEDKGAFAFVAPPQTFCELSYDKALADGVQFYPLETSIPYEQFVQQFEANQLGSQKVLRKNDIAPSF